MPRPRASKPAVLTQAQRWEKQVLGTLTMLESLAKTPIIHGSTWKQGTAAYYKKVLSQLLAQVPRGCQSKARAFRRRLEKV
jgi:hypothetical protein